MPESALNSSAVCSSSISAIDDSNESTKKVSLLGSQTWGDEVCVAISQFDTSLACQLAVRIRHRTGWDVRVLACREAAPWDDLIGKHVVLVDERSAARAFLANRDVPTRRLPWTRLVLMGEDPNDKLYSPQLVGIDAVVRTGCRLDRLIDALAPLVRELRGHSNGEAGTTRRQQTRIAQPRPDLNGARGLRGGLHSNSLRRVRRYVSTHLAKRMSIEQLAAIAGLSPCHFSRAFAQSMGIPPHRYVLIRRIQMAAELMRDTDSPVAEVAAVVGYSDTSHFTRRAHKARLQSQRPS